MRRFARPLAAAVALVLPSFPAPAAADLPPPDGVKFVDFAISVDNLAAFPDVIVVAYPWSASNGAPTTEHFVLREGQPLPIGRRSATPQLWAVKKADYEAFTAGYKPSGSYQDAPLEAFFKSGKAIACDASIQPDHQLPESDSRDSIVQAFRADAIDATRCHLVATGDAPIGKGPSSPSAEGGEPPRENAPAAGKGGCAGCAIDARSAEPVGAFAAMAVALLAALVRRRRR